MAKRKSTVGPRILCIPDTQVKPGVRTEHIAWAARYAAEKRPDAIIQLGDFDDLPSLSSYDAGKLASHGRTYKADVIAGNKARALLMGELRRYAPRGYSPTLIALRGNHEYRAELAVENDPKMKDTIAPHDLDWRAHGWQVVPFLQPIQCFGVTFVHYCPLNAQGRVGASKFGAPSALAQARRMMRSTVCGHRQGLDVATVETPGRRIRGVIAGSFYQHSEAYLTPMGNSHWQGILMLNDIQGGDFDLCEVSLSYLGRKYG
jgi:hypothetical protein